MTSRAAQLGEQESSGDNLVDFPMPGEPFEARDERNGIRLRMNLPAQRDNQADNSPPPETPHVRFLNYKDDWHEFILSRHDRVSAPKERQLRMNFMAGDMPSYSALLAFPARRKRSLEICDTPEFPMNRFSFALIFCVATVWNLDSLAVADDKGPKPDLVFLLIGQSNMAGRAALEEGDEKPIANVLLLDDQGKWIPATNPLNRFATDRKVLSMQRISPGAGFVHEMTEKLPGKTIGLIHNARGGTKIEQWGKGQDLYVHTIERLAKVKNLKVDGVLWHQGEGNRSDTTYLERLTDLVTRLRNDLKNPDLCFVAGEIFGKAIVNDQMAKLVDTVPRTGLAKANELAVFDKVHFDRKSQLTLGKRYATETLRLLESDGR